MTRRINVVVCALGLAAACGRDTPPTSPTPPAPQPQLSPTSIRINGPLVIAPGESHQYSAMATLSDGTTRDVAASATWTVFQDSAGLTVTNGLVTATATGQGTLIVEYGVPPQHKQAVFLVTSRPNGTGILSGVISDGTYPIVGARMEVVDGPFAGRFSTSGSIIGVVGDLTIRVSAPGYVAHTSLVYVQPVVDTPRQETWHVVRLVRAGPPRSLSGNYHAMLRASSFCTTIPPPLAAREYAATVTQNGDELTVVLSGADFALTSANVPADRFVGRIKANVVEFDLGTVRNQWDGGDGNLWGFVERVPPPIGNWPFARGLRLGPAGTATGMPDASGVSAKLDGVLEIFDVDPSTGLRTTLEECFASDHQFVLTHP